jgi:hypothetical protein
MTDGSVQYQALGRLGQGRHHNGLQSPVRAGRPCRRLRQTAPHAVYVPRKVR